MPGGGAKLVTQNTACSESEPDSEECRHIAERCCRGRGKNSRGHGQKDVKRKSGRHDRDNTDRSG